MPNKPPNILLLMTDQQRYDSLGCYGADFAHTPHLDRLAAEGARFTHSYANNPICTPSRASLMTGKPVPDHGVCRLDDQLPPEEILFPHRLRAQGYTTALFGKLHVSAVAAEAERRHPHDGFDLFELCNEGCKHMEGQYQAYARWLEQRDPAFYRRLKCEGRGLTHPPRDLHLTHWAAERTIAFLEHERDREKPFFCMMSIFEPHNPYAHYPLEMGGLVEEAAIPVPTPRGTGPEPPDIARERHGNYFADFNALSREDIRAMRHGYHAAVAYADLEFGRVLDKLDALGLRENTLVIFTSDHGDMLGDHDLLVKGAFFFDPNVRVPLLMRWPGGIGGGQRVSGLVQVHDLAATILAAAGVSAENLSAWMPDACNLLGLARGQVQSVREEVYCCYRNSGMSTGHTAWDPPIDATMVRNGRYKCSVWRGRGDGELYDMSADPLEQRNLWVVPEMETIKAGLRDRLASWTSMREG